MSVNKAENRYRKTSRVGRIDSTGSIPLVNTNGHKGKSQRGCFGYKLNKEASK